MDSTVFRPLHLASCKVQCSHCNLREICLPVGLTRAELEHVDNRLVAIRRKVVRGAETIDLAPKEFGILEYMMRNKGRPLSRTMIVEHVWDMDYDGLTNIVDVYIRHLRSKIDDRYPQKLIQTVRGIGYMIEAPEKAAEKPAGPAAVPQV